MIPNLREITVGRDKSCDIYLDDSCKFASRYHGSIFYDGTQLMFRDTSTNGTMINNVRVNHRTVPIQDGDIIMVAGHYQIGWPQIRSFFPQQPEVRSSTPVKRYSASDDVDTSKWNWGAFMLYPIWGFFNGCWWAFLVAVFLGFSLIPNIVFGLCGTRWAWRNRAWGSPQEFVKVQSEWAKWGVVVFCLNIVVLLLGLVVFLASI